MTRRQFCSRALACTAAGAFATTLKGLGQETIESEKNRGFLMKELRDMEDLVAACMEENSVPGMSVAIAKEGRLVYARGFGLASKETGEKVTPDHLFRIASVSKPITATMIFKLIEAGKLHLSDKVFGSGALLGTDYGPLPYPQYVEDITLDHLLTHTAGGWRNSKDDPMFLHTDMDHKQLITWT